MKDRGTVKAEIGLHLFDDHAAEQVRPAVVFGMANIGTGEFGSKAVAVGFSRWRDGRQKIDIGMALKCFGNAQALRRKLRVAGAALVAQHPVT
ncbi:hypothetical protein D3C87_1904220 [compost metagenome]